LNAENADIEAVLKKGFGRQADAGLKMIIIIIIVAPNVKRILLEGIS
jgi:hypothetical protein